ncbi:MJ0570-related uncharacterized domain-containing protein [bacterium JGI 053]|nr:MJ0570-related uncharacterized domain-containing protein [bacterium JGI 053]
MPEPLIMSWSGGKDSALALEALRATGEHDPIVLLTSVTAGYERVAIHGVRRELLRAQADVLGLPLHELILQPDCSNEAYDAALASAVDGLRTGYGARRIAFGDLYLEDVRRYREERVGPLGFELLFPLWGMDTTALAKSFVARGFQARLACVDTTQLDAGFAGRAYDARLLADLPATVDPCGENGEFHTFVTAGPGFRAPVGCTVGEVVMRGDRFAFCDLVPSTPLAS